MMRWITIDESQRTWVQAAIAYYSAKVAIYKLMVAEWEEELKRLNEQPADKVDG